MGAHRFDAFEATYAWLDAARYVSHAAPVEVFLQYASRESFVTPDIARKYLAIVSEPRQLKIYAAEHALNAAATRDRIAFLAEQLSFKSPDPAAVAGIPVLVQPPWPKEQ